MCKEKPNESVRVILNLIGCAVNEGIDEKDFPATMSSTTKLLRVLNSVLEPELEPPGATLFGWSQSRSRKNYAVSAPALAPL